MTPPRTAAEFAAIAASAPDPDEADDEPDTDTDLAPVEIETGEPVG